MSPPKAFLFPFPSAKIKAECITFRWLRIEQEPHILILSISVPPMGLALFCPQKSS